MASKQLRETIIRILSDYKELSGYSTYKMLATKGIKTWPNHVYTLLAGMEKSGLLNSRWVDGDPKKRGNALRKHLYSLSESGRAQYDVMVRGSLGVLMERFFRENLNFEDLSFHVGLVRETLGVPARWSKENAFRLVIASPTYHPLVCFPKFYYAVSEAYPNSSIYVVRSPWENTSLEGRKNLTFLEGSRDDIPLREGFADYVLLQGFPSASSVSATIGECVRVLKDGGCMFLEIPSMLTAEKRVPHTTIFPEYVLTLFYELCGQDRSSVRIEAVTKVLSASFEHVRDVEVRGKVIIYAADKKAKAGQDAGIPRDGSLGSRVASVPNGLTNQIMAHAAVNER